MTGNKHINLVYSCDENYIQLLVPCIISVIDNKNTDTSIDIFILETGINNYHKSKIKELEIFKNTNNVKIEFINVAERAEKLILNKDNFEIDYKNHLTNAILYRLLIPQIFADKGRVLSLDVDTIVQKDLLDIYNEGFEDNYLIASKADLLDLLKKGWLKSIYYKDNYYTPECFYKNIFNLPEYMLVQGNEHYINAGVMLFNITKINEDKKDTQLIDTFVQYQESLIWAEQDVIVKVFLDKIKNLGWLKHMIDSNFDLVKSNTLKPIIKRIKEAHIIHFAHIKPHKLNKAFKTISINSYLKYLQMSYLRISKLKILWSKFLVICKYCRRRKIFTIPYILFNRD